MRHIGAYVELAGLDLARAHREISNQLVALAILVIAALFALFLLCVGVIALTWDTSYRVAAIAWMGGVFVLIAIGALVYRSKLARARSPLLADVRREWHEDRVILERILSSDED